MIRLGKHIKLTTAECLRLQRLIPEVPWSQVNTVARYNRELLCAKKHVEKEDTAEGRLLGAILNDFFLT